MAGPKITLYLDVVSPFAYIAYYVLRVSAAVSFRMIARQSKTISFFLGSVYASDQSDKYQKNSPTFARCDINYVPIFLGGLMHACNNRAPIQIKSKSLNSTDVVCVFALIHCWIIGSAGSD